MLSQVERRVGPEKRLAKIIAASRVKGSPVAVADLRLGDRVLDVGCGAGLDVLLSALRVGPSGFASGIDQDG